MKVKVKVGERTYDADCAKNYKGVWRVYLAQHCIKIARTGDLPNSGWTARSEKPVAGWPEQGKGSSIAAALQPFYAAHDQQRREVAAKEQRFEADVAAVKERLEPHGTAATVKALTGILRNIRQDWAEPGYNTNTWRRCNGLGEVIAEVRVRGRGTPLVVVWTISHTENGASYIDEGVVPVAPVDDGSAVSDKSTLARSEARDVARRKNLADAVAAAKAEADVELAKIRRA